MTKFETAGSFWYLDKERRLLRREVKEQPVASHEVSYVAPGEEAKLVHYIISRGGSDGTRVTVMLEKDNRTFVIGPVLSEEEVEGADR